MKLNSMNKKGKKSRNIAGCLINDYEQNLYDELQPYDWDSIYLPFKEEMTMFRNIIYLAKNIPFDKMPTIAGCTPNQYFPLMKIMERIYDSIKRLEEVPKISSHPPKLETSINARITKYAKSQRIKLVGFTVLEPTWVFPPSDNWIYPQAHQPIKHNHVISLGLEMSHDVLNINRHPDAETLYEALKTYASLGEKVEKITEFIRKIGYKARGHHPYAGDFLYSAFAVKSGVGQLGANGLVLTKKYGPRQRFAAITTDAPIEVTKPRDLGLDDLCYMCMRCVNACPVKALSPYKINWRGTLKWKLNHKRCWHYFVANNGCGLCISVCPWNKRDSWYHYLTANAVSWSRIFRRLLLIVDNLFYWKKANTNPLNNRIKQKNDPFSFATMLKVMGKEKFNKNTL